MPDELDSLKELGRELAEPDAESVSRARDLLEQRIAVARSRSEARSGRMVSDAPRLGSRPRVRWALVLAAAALLVGSGLGFSVGSAVTPSGRASGDAVGGFGFIPARGWNVLQTGTLDPNGVARAIAANVRLERDDDLTGLPLATVASLPRKGVLVFATFSPRGDPSKDFGFPVRELPLQLEDAERLPSKSDPVPFGSIGRYRLPAAVGGYNVDVRIYFGAADSSMATLAAAQRQLNRLVLASELVTIFARPPISGLGQTVWLFGSVDNGKAGEVVDIQAKDCGQQFFRGLTGATTTEGGAWRTNFFPSINTSVRAVWEDNASPAVAIRKRAAVHLRQRSAKRFSVAAFGGNSTSPFWRKRALFQRFDGRVGRWRTVKSVVLTSSSTSGTEFTASVPRGTLVRAVLPLSQARPCWIAGVSRTFRRG